MLERFLTTLPSPSKDGSGFMSTSSMSDRMFLEPVPAAIGLYNDLDGVDLTH